MVRQPNPYRPGFNQAPARLVGRDTVVDAAREALEVAALDGRTPRPLALIGPRGVGKTVLLGEIASLAGQWHSWPAVQVEARPGASVAAELSDRLRAVTPVLGRSAPPRRPDNDSVRVTGGKVSAAGFGVGAEVMLSRDPPPPGAATLDDAFSGAMEEALRHRTGLLVTVDELQLAEREDSAALAAVLQLHVPDNWPLVVVLAGLPSLRDPRRSPTYLERAEWHELGLLDDDDTLAALTEPAREAGRPMSGEAAAELARASGGYPYAVQLHGHFAWRASAGRDRITLEHARTAVERAAADLAGLFAARWEDCAPREQEYLAVLAELGDDGAGSSGVGNADVARYLGRAPNQTTYLRQRLARKGIVDGPGQALRFFVPGMAGWIREHHPAPAPA